MCDFNCQKCRYARSLKILFRNQDVALWMPLLSRDWHNLKSYFRKDFLSRVPARTWSPFEPTLFTGGPCHDIPIIHLFLCRWLYLCAFGTVAATTCMFKETPLDFVAIQIGCADLVACKVSRAGCRELHHEAGIGFGIGKLLSATEIALVIEVSVG